MKRKNREIALIFVWIVLVTAASLPYIYFNGMIYGLVKYAIFAIMLLLSLSCSFYKSFNNGFLRRSLILVGLTGLLFFILVTFHFKPALSDPLSLFIILWGMSLGYRSILDDVQMDRFLIIYCVLTIILGVISLVYFTGTVSLETYEYAVETKNQVGQMLATGTIGLLIGYASSKRYFTLKVFLIILSIILLVILRCRTALLAFMLIGLFFVNRNFKLSKKVVLVLVFFTIFILFYSQLSDMLGRVFVGRHDIEDLDSLSANRWERNVQGLAFIRYNPIWGELKVPSGIENIHNYVIKRYVLYGLFSLPFLGYYLVFSVKVFRQWIKSSFSEMMNSGLYMLFIPFFSSLLEPSAPFGPGLVQVIPYFFYGAYLHYIDVKSKTGA